ncbi:MAG TPA: hypothetical protein VNG29_00230 [Candidatus Paceibacterota bacterium]|nr:hypothetical protein [Candidatus Paceibacterota bacterium]
MKKFFKKKWVIAIIAIAVLLVGAQFFGGQRQPVPVASGSGSQ